MGVEPMIHQAHGLRNQATGKGGYIGAGPLILDPADIGQPPKEPGCQVGARQ